MRTNPVESYGRTSEYYAQHSMDIREGRLTAVIPVQKISDRTRAARQYGDRAVHEADSAERKPANPRPTESTAPQQKPDNYSGLVAAGVLLVLIGYVVVCCLAG